LKRRSLGVNRGGPNTDKAAEFSKFSGATEPRLPPLPKRLVALIGRNPLLSSATNPTRLRLRRHPHSRQRETSAQALPTLCRICSASPMKPCCIVMSISPGGSYDGGLPATPQAYGTLNRKDPSASAIHPVELASQDDLRDSPETTSSAKLPHKSVVDSVASAYAGPCPKPRPIEIHPKVRRQIAEEKAIHGSIRSSLP